VRVIVALHKTRLNLFEVTYSFVNEFMHFGTQNTISSCRKSNTFSFTCCIRHLNTWTRRQRILHYRLRFSFVLNSRSSRLTYHTFPTQFNWILLCVKLVLPVGHYIRESLLADRKLLFWPAHWNVFTFYGNCVLVGELNVFTLNF
jgi:hypothetical protein